MRTLLKPAALMALKSCWLTGGLPQKVSCEAAWGMPAVFTASSELPRFQPVPRSAVLTAASVGAGAGGGTGTGAGLGAGVDDPPLLPPPQEATVSAAKPDSSTRRLTRLRNGIVSPISRRLLKAAGRIGQSPLGLYCHTNKGSPSLDARDRPTSTRPDTSTAFLTARSSGPRNGSGFRSGGTV